MTKPTDEPKVMAKSMDEMQLVDSDEEENPVDVDNDNTNAATAKEESSAMEKLEDQTSQEDDTAAALDVKDEHSLRKSLAALHEKAAQDQEAEKIAEKKLAAIAIDPASVELLMYELELSKSEADRALRLANGDLRQCISSFIS